RELDLSGNQLSDSGAVALAPLVNLESLNLGGARITDRGLAALENFQKLSSVELDDCDEITNSGLAKFPKLSTLHAIALSGCYVSEEGVASLADRCGDGVHIEYFPKSELARWITLDVARQLALEVLGLFGLNISDGRDNG